MFFYRSASINKMTILKISDVGQRHNAVLSDEVFTRSGGRYVDATTVNAEKDFTDALDGVLRAVRWWNRKNGHVLMLARGLEQ